MTKYLIVNRFLIYTLMLYFFSNRLRSVNMKPFYSLIAFILISSFTIAQNTVGTPEQLKQFLKTKTLVVLDEDPFNEANIQLKTAVQKNWKLTEYEFINVEDYEIKKKNPQFSFLTIDKVYYDGDKSASKYNFLCIALGGNYKNESEMPQLCTVPLSYADAEQETYCYKIATMLNFLQNHIILTSKNQELKSSNIIDYYKKNLAELKNKTLYVAKDELDKLIGTEDKFKKIYPYKFKFVTRDEIEEAIDNNNQDVVFLHKVGPEKMNPKARCWNILIGAGDAKLYFFDYHKIDENHPDALLESELKKIVNK